MFSSPDKLCDVVTHFAHKWSLGFLALAQSTHLISHRPHISASLHVSGLSSLGYWTDIPTPHPSIMFMALTDDDSSAMFMVGQFALNDGNFLLRYDH
jgi:hypothetical protein